MTTSSCLSVTFARSYRLLVLSSSLSQILFVHHVAVNIVIMMMTILITTNISWENAEDMIKVSESLFLSSRQSETTDTCVGYQRKYCYCRWTSKWRLLWCIFNVYRRILDRLISDRFINRWLCQYVMTKSFQDRHSNQIWVTRVSIDDRGIS